MKCRKITDNKKIIWFGSAGKDENNKKIPYENYSTEQEGVKDSLTQRLSVIKGELWYNLNAGIPLLDKNSSDVVYDSYISSTIMKHPMVLSIKKFVSVVENHKYRCSIIVETVYGDIEMTI